MPHIPRDIIDAIRDRVDILELVGRHVRMERSGTSWKGLCPFHNEKTPSFYVIPAKQMFFCHGCQVGGDCFGFLMRTQNLSFTEAATRLAQETGITIERAALSDAERRALRQRSTMFSILEDACQFFEAQLLTGAEGAPARAYLERRGTTPEVARTWRLGWAPDAWSQLTDHLRRRGHSDDLMVTAGLARPRAQGPGLYDAFRARVMVPICDDRGRVIAFGGRILDGDGPKYINSPQTPLYDKGSVLFGLNKAQNAVRSSGRLILVEGYFDVITMHQHGFAEAVATCGTALTPEHVQRIAKLTQEVVLLTDADEAGSRAAEKALSTLRDLRAGHVRTTRLQIPGAKDPDELLRAEGANAMKVALDAREPLLHWVARRRLKTLGYDAAGRASTLQSIADELVGLSGHEARDLAAILQMPEPEVLRLLRTPRAKPPQRPADEADDDGWRPTADLTHLIWLVLHHYDSVADLLHRATPHLIDPKVRPSLARFLTGEPAVRVLDELPEGRLRRTIAACAARDALYTAEQAPRGLVDALHRLARPRYDRRRAELQDAILTAQRERRAADALAATRALTRLQAAWMDAERTLKRGALPAAVDALNALYEGDLQAEPPTTPPPPAPSEAPRTAPPTAADEPSPRDEDPPVPDYFVEGTDEAFPDDPWEDPDEDA
jgi:DNA primase catalytic core